MDSTCRASLALDALLRDKDAENVRIRALQVAKVQNLCARHGRNGRGAVRTVKQLVDQCKVVLDVELGELRGVSGAETRTAHTSEKLASISAMNLPRNSNTIAALMFWRLTATTHMLLFLTKK